MKNPISLNRGDSPGARPIPFRGSCTYSRGGKAAEARVKGGCTRGTSLQVVRFFNPSCSSCTPTATSEEDLPIEAVDPCATNHRDREREKGVSGAGGRRRGADETRVAKSSFVAVALCFASARDARCSDRQRWTDWESSHTFFPNLFAAPLRAYNAPHCIPSLLAVNLSGLLPMWFVHTVMQDRGNTQCVYSCDSSTHDLKSCFFTPRATTGVEIRTSSYTRSLVKWRAKDLILLPILWRHSSSKKHSSLC